MRIRVICERVPEAWLARWLKRNKFEEEKFATIFALDKEQIYRPKSAWSGSHHYTWPKCCIPQQSLMTRQRASYLSSSG
jgi:hypothetical protein